MAAPQWLNRTKLLKDCVRSAVFHLDKDLKKLDEVDSIQVEEERNSKDGGTASKATKEKSKKHKTKFGIPSFALSGSKETGGPWLGSESKKTKKKGIVPPTLDGFKSLSKTI